MLLKGLKIINPVNRMLLSDITLQLPHQFLTKVDRSTMAAEELNLEFLSLTKNLLSYLFKFHQIKKLSYFKDKKLS